MGGSSSFASGLYLRLAQWNADHRAQVEGNNTLPSGEIERTAGIGNQKFRIRTDGIFEDGVRDSFVIEQGFAFAIAARSQTKFANIVFQKHVASLGSGQLQ